VEESTAETLDIGICLTSRIRESFQRWRNRVILWLFQKKMKLPLFRLAKILDFPEPHF
jgi:hypothetical protein